MVGRVALISIAFGACAFDVRPAPTTGDDGSGDDAPLGIDALGPPHALAFGTPVQVALDPGSGGSLPGDPMIVSDRTQLLYVDFRILDFDVLVSVPGGPGFTYGTLSNLSTTQSERTPRLAPDDLLVFYTFDGLVRAGRRATKTSTDFVRDTTLEAGLTAITNARPSTPTSTDPMRIVISDNGIPSEYIYTASRWDPVTGALDNIISTFGPKVLGASYLSPDGRTLVMGVGASGVSSSFDLYVAYRTTVEAPFGVPTLLAAVNTATVGEYSPSIAADGTLYFASSDGNEALSIWMAAPI